MNCRIPLNRAHAYYGVHYSIVSFKSIRFDFYKQKIPAFVFREKTARKDL